MITPRTIQAIMDTARIEEVIDEFVTMKKRGVNLLGLCPFHNEKTPSFTVSPNKQIFKCFGCGKGGNIVHFLMEHEHLTYPEALRFLARKYQIEVEETGNREENRAERQLIESLLLINQLATDFYKKQLYETDAGKSIGLSYFRERGYRKDMIETFDLGFAPGTLESFTNYAIGKGFKLENLKKAGLTSTSGKDFFRNRVLFAIHNITGKVIGFGGRTLSTDKKIPKYINTPETEVYIKSRVLYGIHQAKNTIRKTDECILVEGYTDVISLYQSGIQNVVASSGTSLTNEQVRLIKRFTPNIKILFDGDIAGIKAALRGIDMFLEQNLNVKIVILPEGDDPDSFLNRVGASQFTDYIDNQARDFIFFKTSLVLEETDDPVKRSALVKDIVESISKIPDPIKRAVYIKECSVKLEINETVLIREANKMVTRQIQRRKQSRAGMGSQIEQIIPEGVDLPKTQSTQEKIEQARLTDEHQEKAIARILISSSSEWFDETENKTIAAFVLENIADSLDSFEIPIYRSIVHEANSSFSKGKFLPPEHFIMHENEEVRNLAVDFLTESFDYSPNWEKKFDSPLQTQPMPEKNFKNDAIYAVRRFRLKKIEKLCDLNKQRLADATDEQERLRLIKVQQKLYEMRDELSKYLNTVIFR